MYVGPTFAPLSLLGLAFKGSSVATLVPNTTVSAVVPVHNGERSIESCIKHLEDQSLMPFEVIVVDDCSKDRTPIILGALSKKYNNLIVLRNDENLGKSASITTALDSVRSHYTAIIDSDTYLDRDYFKNLLGVFHRDEVVAASGMVLPSESDSSISKSRLIEYLHGQSTHKKVQIEMGVSFVSPGCCSIWRTEWLKKNGIPTDTVVEDMDLTWEAQVDDKKLAYVPDAVAYTEEPDSFTRYLKQINRWFSWRPVLEKHSKEMTNGLKFLVSWMLAESIGYIIWIGFMLLFLLSGRFLPALILFSLDFMIITLISMYQGSKSHLSLRKIITAIPYYYMLRIPTAVVFWKSFIVPKRTGW